VAGSDTRLRPGERYTAGQGTVPMTGVQALARLAVNVRRADRAAGRDTALFIAGYEGSPLAGYDLELQRHADVLAAHDIVFRPAVNEELAATSVQGTQLAPGTGDARVGGVTAFWYGKSPGLDRACDALRHANLMGTDPRGGAVAFVGDDPAAKSSTVPGASEFLLADLGMPVLYPADPQDVLDLGHHAVAMSRLSGLWVAVKIATNVADGVGTVEVGSDRVQPVLPDVRFEHTVNARMLPPALLEMENTRDGVRLDAARAYARANQLNTVHEYGSRPRVGVVAAGKTYLDVSQALGRLGLDERERHARGLRVLRLGMIHPLVPAEVGDFVRGLNEVIVIEEKRSFVEAALKDILYGVPGAPRIVGKTGPNGRPLVASAGELDADLIAEVLARRLGELGGFPTVDAWQDRRVANRTVTQLPLVPRTPYFCSGCPHNTSTKVPSGSMVGGGIGCHALVLMMEPDAVGDVLGLTQMGGEGAQWIGLAPFLKTRRHLLQNIGDGTFHHSGSLAVRAAVAAGVNITYKLLYNSAVAMTGGQQAVGGMPVAALTRSLAAEGVRRIIITTEEVRRYRGADLAPVAQVWSRDRLDEAQRELSAAEGVTVLIHDQECATELRRKRKRGLAADPGRRIMINERVCEGCGDCGRKSNCLSVQPVDTDFGRKTAIDQSSCNKDFSCLAGDCPSFLEIRPAARTKPRRLGPSLAADAASDPIPRLDVRDLAGAVHTTRITGVGGTGVVTVSQILTAAARLAGLEVRSLDQTGLAQKGGAVVSDIKISGSVFEAAAKAAAGECDLYLGCDLLVAADAKNLVVANRDRTLACVSTTKVPTGRMVVDPTIDFPDVAVIADQIRAATCGPDAVFFDARWSSVTLFGTDQYANMLLSGAAFQAGALPLPASAIEQAIELNGAEVDRNVQAFRRGRQAVADPPAFAAALDALTVRAPEREPGVTERETAATVGTPADSELARVVLGRVTDLVDYQSATYARQYAAFVAAVAAAEQRTVPGSTALSEAVARNLYKLMAYKDEYEVARLSLDPDVGAAVAAEFGPGARVSYLLHPPVLRALGIRRKITLGPWFRPAFRALRAARRLRGTPFDPFGRARVRRIERELITEYRATVAAMLPHLSPDTLPRCVDIASAPDEVRGYEGIKLASLVRYRARLDELAAGLGSAARVKGAP
jgi:indolepyruvate ferredoxin oxidoreductase